MGIDLRALYQIIDLYFQGGWRVAPFTKKEGGGYSGVKGWPKRAARSHEELAALVAEMRGPYIFGIVPNEGQYIVDLDNKNNKAGSTNWDKHLKALFPLNDAPSPSCIVKSKSGGYHLYYHHDKKVKLPSPTAILGSGSGIDVRGYSGMVIMPTSIAQEAQWVPGEYTIISGSPAEKPSYLTFNLIVPRASLRTAAAIELSVIQDAVMNRNYPPGRRAEALPEFVIPESARDQTLFLAAKICRRGNLSEADATSFCEFLALRCELAENESTDHWIELARDKVRRVYEGEHRLLSLADFYAELDYAGIVKCAAESGSIYYVRYGSSLLNIPARRGFTTDGLRELLRGKVVGVSEKGAPIYAHAAINNWDSKIIVDSYGMLPKEDTPFFENSVGHLCVNTYIPAFEGVEIDSDYLAQAREEMLPLFKKLVTHVAGGEAEGRYLTQKFAWIVQKPYLKPVTANIIYSQTRGAGKDSLLDLIGQLVYKDYYIKLQDKDLSTRFAMFHEKLIAVFSEVQVVADGPSKRDVVSLVGRLKQLITNRQITIEEKFKPVRVVDSYTNFFILSNYELYAIMEPGERRLDVFHSVEEKIDQNIFGPILDLANKQNRNDTVRFSNTIRKYWDHCLYAIRDYLHTLPLTHDFSKHEAVLSEAKVVLMKQYAGDPSAWIKSRLPIVFTKEMVQWLATMSPYKVDHRFAFENLRSAYGSNLLHVTARNSPKEHLRVFDAPELVARDDGMGRSIYALVTGTKFRSYLYSFEDSVQENLVGARTLAELAVTLSDWIQVQLDLYRAPIHSTLPHQPQQINPQDVLH